MGSLSKKAREFREILRRKLYHARVLGVRPDETVLDLGSGHAPNWRANILCDKFTSDGTERLGSGLAYPAGRPFVVGDGLRLPFRDQAFDFVICSHVLEHVSEPERLLQELARVGRRGYIETPSRAWEKLHSFPYHKWLVHQDNQTIILQEKPQPILDPDLQEWFDHQVATSPLFQRVWMRYWEYGLAFQYWWQGEIKCEVRHASVPPETSFAGSQVEAGAAAGLPEAAGGTMARIDATYGRWLRRRSQGRLRDWQALLACPLCHGSLQPAEGRLTCSSCGAAYPVDGGTPVLLEEAVL